MSRHNTAMEYTNHVYFDDEKAYRYIKSAEDFVQIIEEKLGHEVAMCCEDLMTDVVTACPGECDNTYRMQEHYEDVIESAADDLNGFLERNPKVKDAETIRHVIEILNAEMR